MATTKFILYLFFLTAVTSACSPAIVVKPLEKGEARVGGHFGGPLISYGNAPIPLPLTSLQTAYGLDTNLSISGALHTTSLLFGVAHLEAHLAYGGKIDATEKWGFTLSPGFHLITDFYEGNFKAYPDLQVLEWLKYGQKERFFYSGVGTWVELQKEKAHGEIHENGMLPWVQIGHFWERPKFTYSVEAKYIAPFTSHEDIVVDYVAPGKTGAIGVYFSINYRIGNR